MLSWRSQQRTKFPLNQDHTLEDITKMKKAINDDQTYQNLAKFDQAHKLILHHKCLEKIDPNFVAVFKGRHPKKLSFRKKTVGLGGKES